MTDLYAQTKTPDPETLAGDRIIGASAIALFLYGDPTLTRRVYHLLETTQFPSAKFGGRWSISKATVRAWLKEKERENLKKELS